MYKKFMILVPVCLSMLVGCGTVNSQESAPQQSSSGIVTGHPASTPTAAPVAASGSVKQKLDATAKKLVSNAAKNVTPSVKNKAVTKQGNEYVASYTMVDESAVSTEVRPSSGKAGTYIGIIRYPEYRYECRGKTKVQALAAPCNKVRTRHMKELISYDGKKWTY